MATKTSTLVASLIDRVTAPSRGIARAMKSLNTASKANARQLRATQGSMIGAVGAAYALQRAISAPVSAAIEFEGAMADVKKVVNFETPQQFAQLSQDILKLSRTLPLSATGIADIVAAAGQAGMAGDELLAFTKMAAKVGVAFDISANQAGEALAKMKTAMSLSVSETGMLAGAMNHLTNNMASSAPDLVNFMKRVAVQGEAYGFAATETAAIGSAMIAAGAEAEVAATSFQNVGRALTKGSQATNNQKAAFKTLGLSSTQVAKDMQSNATGTLRNVIMKIKELPDYMQAAALSAIFGDEARALAPLVNNLDLYDKALLEVSDSSKYANSAMEEYAVRAETAGNKLQTFKNQTAELAIRVGEALLPAIISITDGMRPFIEAFAQFAQDHPQVVTAVVAVTAGLVALNIAAIAARFSFLFMKGGMISGVSALVGLGPTLLTLINPLALVRGAMTALKLAVVSTGIGLILVAIAMAGVWIYQNWEGLTAFFQGFGSAFMEAMAPVMPVIQPIVDAVGWLASGIQNMVGPVDASTETWRGWGETIGGSVASAIKNIIEMFQKLTGWITSAKDAVVGMGSAVASIWGGSDSQASQGTANRKSRRAGIAGARALGGPVKAGLIYMTGERGRELFTAPADGYIHNASRTADMVSNLSSGVRMAPHTPSSTIRANDNASNSNAPSQAVSVGPIYLQNPVNASAEEIGDAVGRNVAAAVRGNFGDGGV